MTDILSKSCAMNNSLILHMVTRVRHLELSHHCVVTKRFCATGGTFELFETRSVLGRSLSVLSPYYFIFSTHSYPFDAAQYRRPSGISHWKWFLRRGNHAYYKRKRREDKGRWFLKWAIHRLINNVDHNFFCCMWDGKLSGIATIVVIFFAQNSSANKIAPAAGFVFTNISF